MRLTHKGRVWVYIQENSLSTLGKSVPMIECWLRLAGGLRVQDPVGSAVSVSITHGRGEHNLKKET